MAKIAQRSIKITTDGVDVAGFNIRVKKAIQGDITYNDAIARQVPFVTGQLVYIVPIDETYGITDGQWNVGLTSYDAAGNESDLAVKQYFFDFVAPSAPSFEII